MDSFSRMITLETVIPYSFASLRRRMVRETLAPFLIAVLSNISWSNDLKAVLHQTYNTQPL
ncbi:MAG: hypothetical protein M2R46_04869 [Verrucomicrobia subdivision 3 bacterium]|nr:hypothetical protein [Limisphaerales bacterium]